MSRRSTSTSDPITEEESAPEIPFDQRPVASLTPKSDGHWLKLNLQNINRVVGAKLLEYEIIYTTSDERQQGSSGKVDVATAGNIDRDILLGSESSGKFRYDEGVTEGNLTLRWRNEKGKLAGKLSTAWHLQSSTDTLTSSDAQFTYKLNQLPKAGYFVTMETFGIPQGVTGLTDGPYGVFASEAGKFPGTVTLGSGKVSLWNEASWLPLEAGKSLNAGIFVTTSN